MSVGLAWASRISALGFELSAPPILGSYVDRWLGSSPIGILVGTIVGFAVAMIHLLRIARDSSKPV